jgi:competence protein ComEA
MIALSGIGMASMLKGTNGVPVPLAGMLGADIHAAWLANESAAGPREKRSSPALTAGSASRPGAASATGNAADNAMPVVSAPAGAGEGTGAAAPAKPSAGVTADGKVILNQASAEDLRHLPGVGPKRADAIMSLRARLGRFKQINDLLRVKGIGVRGLKKIMPHVVLDAPKPAA